MQISVPSRQNMPKSEIVVAVLQRTWQIVVCLSHLFVFLAYCTISTNCSQGVTRDTREHYHMVFTSQILAVTGTKTVHL